MDILNQPKREDSPGDKEWVERLPSHLRKVAEEFGRRLFEFCINRRMAQECISHLGERIKARDAQVRLGGLAGSMNRLAQLALEGQGWSGEEVAKCDRALMVAISLAGQDDRPGIELPPGANRH